MPLKPRSAHALSRICVALGLSFGMIASSAAPSLAAFGTEKVAPSDTTEVVEAPPILTLAPSTIVLDSESQRFEFSARVENPGAEKIPGGTLSLELSPQRIETTDQLSEAFPDAGTPVSEIEFGGVAPEETQSATVTVRRESFPLTASDAPGVYVMRAIFTPKNDAKGATESDEVVSAAQQIIGTTPFVWRGAFDPGTTASGASEAGDPSLNADQGDESATSAQAATRTPATLGLIIPIVLPSNSNAMPSRKQLDEAVPRLAALVDTAESTQATLAIDPRIIAGIRAFGDEASQQSRQFLDRLETTQAPTFLLQFADADPAAQAALGFTKLLAPKNLDYVSRQGSRPPADPPTSNQAGSEASGSDQADADHAPADQSGIESDASSGEEHSTERPEGEPSPDEQSTAEVPADLPSLESLLEWPQGTRPTAWPADGQVDSATVSLLRSSGITRTVLSSDNVILTGGPRAEFETDTALISDAPLTELTQRALASDDETERLAALSEAASRLALSAQTAGHDTLIAFDRGAIAEAEDPSAIISQLTSLSWVDTGDIEGLQAGAASLRSSSPLEERRELLRSAANQEADVDALSVLLENPDDLTGYQRARLLLLFATRYAAPETDFPAVAAQYSERDTELRLGVQAISTEHTQLVGTSTRVPLQLRNYLPFDAIVSVSVTPASAAIQLKEQNFNDIAVPPDGNSRVFVPVLSRVSSGETALEITVTDVAGETVSSSATLPLTIRSSIETIGLWTLGVLSVLLLVFGTARSLRKRRRRASKARLEAGEADPSLTDQESPVSE